MMRYGNEITITEDESKICLLDNKKFKSSKEMMWYVRKTYKLSFEEYIIRAYYNNCVPKCLKTGNPIKFKPNKFGPWFSNYSRNNFPRKPHSAETKRKIRESCEKTSLEKFGVKNVFITDWCKEKIRKTNIQKYGVENVMQSNNIKILFSNYHKSIESIEKTKNTNLNKYGVDHLFKTPEYELPTR